VTSLAPLLKTGKNDCQYIYNDWEVVKQQNVDCDHKLGAGCWNTTTAAEVKSKMTWKSIIYDWGRVVLNGGKNPVIVLWGWGKKKCAAMG
jgi:hypothetical protein